MDANESHQQAHVCALQDWHQNEQILAKLKPQMPGFMAWLTPSSHSKHNNYVGRANVCVCVSERAREREREEIYLDMEQWWYMSFSPSAADQYLHAMVLGVHRSMSWCNELMPLGRIATTAQTESHHCERRIAKSYIMIPKLTSECNSCHIQSETKKLLNVIPRVFLKLRPVTEKKKLNHQ